ncbi:MAG: acyl-CoA thioesterase-2 [Cellvibrionaceae bacterium]|jgi:acyl-CoA thioesterase-2
MADLQNLIQLLALEKTSENQFTASGQDVGSGRVFGGQVLGQAISAAQKTVVERTIHSAHAYFLRPGDFTQPITYLVDKTRDGNSYSARTITAAQEGKTLFTMMCSFQKQEISEFDYSESIDTVSFYEKCNVGVNIESSIKDPSIVKNIQSSVLNNQPFMIKFPTENECSTDKLERFCIKTNAALPNNPDLHRSLLAYLSDFRVLASGLRPTGYRFRLDEVMLATICHGIWFHRNFKMDDWLFISCEPLSVSNGRSLSRGSIYNNDGLLVASTVQEGVIRKKR